MAAHLISHRAENLPITIVHLIIATLLKTRALLPRTQTSILALLPTLGQVTFQGHELRVAGSAYTFLAYYVSIPRPSGWGLEVVRTHC